MTKQILMIRKIVLYTITNICQVIKHLKKLPEYKNKLRVLILNYFWYDTNIS